MKHILPKGYLASGIHCGLKRFKKDLALIYSRAGCKAAGVFTTNKVKAAPLVVTKSILKKAAPVRAIIINSGNANCCTGWHGIRDAKRMINAVCGALRLKFNSVLVSSTGLIGKRLPIAFIEESVPKLAGRLSEKGLVSALKAIMTTDKKMKIAIEKIKIGSKEVILSGIAKGAGMRSPDMATMLAFVMTDARIDRGALKAALKDACEGSFNSITIDGDMSTNDTALLLANGAAGNKSIKKGTKEYKTFLKALGKVTFKLAKDIVLDGEGATKFVSVYVENAKTTGDAYRVARAIANSCLVKTSIHGENPNWGRVASSVGASGVKSIKPSRMEIYLDKTCVFRKGRFTNLSREKLFKLYKRKNVEIAVSLNLGKKDAAIWTCDLSKRYVEINSHYMT